MGFEHKELDFLKERINNAYKTSLEGEMTEIAEFIARELITIVRGRTPESKPVTINGHTYWAYEFYGKRLGGDLNRAWLKDNENLIVHKFGHQYVVTVVNNTYWASFVEEGHAQHVGEKFPVYVDGKLEYRTHKQGFIKGQHYLRLSEKDLERKSQSLVGKKINRYFTELFNVK